MGIPLLWLKHDVTLVSSLSVLEVRTELSRRLPRFAVPSGEVLPRVGLSISRYYLGTLRADQALLAGPYGRGRKTVAALSIQGAIVAGDGGGTRIQLSVRPAKAILGLCLLCASGIIAAGLFAVLEQAWVFALGLLIAFCLFGAAFYAVARLCAIQRLDEFLHCFEVMLQARRQT